MKIFTAPESLHNVDNYKTRIFLAGSIDNGKAANWQLEASRKIGYKGLLNTCIFNPRRLDWDSDLDAMKVSPTLYQQVSWELQALEKATLVIMYFEPGSISPVSLLELGTFNEKCKVICPEGYFRKANVDIFCERYEVPVYSNLDELINDL
jgi:hypothetical protein